jgi:ferrous iron transport protein B
MTTAAFTDTADTLHIALIGSPNSGKTTLFNALTGARAKVGNYPGVTVERREGLVRNVRRRIHLLDLPGTYSLNPETPDEEIVREVVAGEREDEPPPDALALVVDGTTLARGLGLAAQVLHVKRPTVLVVTMVDEVRARGGKLDLGKLSRMLGIPVLGVVGHRGVGLTDLRALLERVERWATPQNLPPLDDPEARFAWVDRVAEAVGGRSAARDERTDRIDRVLLHPIAGLLIFAAVMVFLFQSIFSWALPAMDLIDGVFGTLARFSRLLIDGVFGTLARFSRLVLPPGLLTDLWADGIVAGVGSVLVFLPQIVIVFTLIHFLEDVGYMARAAFVVDRVMGWVGLQGRCFVSLLSSYACAIPGIMAARTVPSPRRGSRSTRS